MVCIRWSKAGILLDQEDRPPDILTSAQLATTAKSAGDTKMAQLTAYVKKPPSQETVTGK